MILTENEAKWLEKKFNWHWAHSIPLLSIRKWTLTWKWKFSKPISTSWDERRNSLKRPCEYSSADDGHFRRRSERANRRFHSNSFSVVLSARNGVSSIETSFIHYCLWKTELIHSHVIDIWTFWMGKVIHPLPSNTFSNRNIDQKFCFNEIYRL